MAQVNTAIEIGEQPAIIHRGSSGFTVTVVENRGVDCDVRIEYGFASDQEATTMLVTLLHMLHETVGNGSIENALNQFFDEKGWMRTINGKKYAHIKYKRGKNE